MNFDPHNLDHLGMQVLAMKELGRELREMKPDKPYPSEEELSRHERFQGVIRRCGALLVRLGRRLERVGLRKREQRAPGRPRENALWRV
ncbi:MAG: hypothetical protein J2P37_28260 [Ktedonobacteraceae bacterium]|nr:hypothetical protein [Ktedonobacteraceae bacterium]